MDEYGVYQVNNISATIGTPDYLKKQKDEEKRKKQEAKKAPEDKEKPAPEINIRVTGYGPHASKTDCTIKQHSYN